jgi:hypothetical protein
MCSCDWKCSRGRSSFAKCWLENWDGSSVIAFVEREEGESELLVVATVGAGSQDRGSSCSSRRRSSYTP